MGRDRLHLTNPNNHNSIINRMGCMDYKITFNWGRAGRVRQDDVIEDFEEPRFGFYWWLWLPVFNHNNGIMKNREVVDVSLTWLCFWAGFTLWPRRKNG